MFFFFFLWLSFENILNDKYYALVKEVGLIGEMTDLGTGAVSTENEHGPFYSDLAAAAAFYSGRK